jgi:hypothetical protein
MVRIQVAAPAVALFAMLSACTYSTEAMMVSAPASEVRSDKRSELAASVYFDPSLDSLAADAAKNSYTCSAHKFPIVIGPAVKASLRRVLDESFRSVDVRRASQFDQPNVVDIRVKPDSFRPMVQFSQGFWSVSTTAQAELVLRVSAWLNGREIIAPTTIAGEGSSMGGSGGCGKGADAVNIASTEAVKRAMENFVYKVVNSGDLRMAQSLPSAVSGAAPVQAAMPAIAPAVAPATFEAGTTGASQLGGGVSLVPAKTPSGFCIVAPANYAGIGTASRPSVTSATPRCDSLTAERAR